jgi:iron complex outermembrane receptor protein
MKRAVLALSIAGALSGGDVALANEALQIEEIQVTARRVEEDMQSVPLSVVAMGAENLEKRNISNLGDLNTVIPNLTIGSGGGFGGSISSIFIRGIGQDRSASTAESGVGTYIDGIFLGQSDGGLIDLVDAERIEVLRGPQGTLFGKNSIGGAINYVSKRPSNEKEGRLKFTVGEFDRLDVEGMVNLPLTDDMAVRLSALSKTRDGHVKDVFSPNNPVDLGNTDVSAIRGQLMWDVNQDLQVSFTYDWVSSKSNGGAQNIIEGNPNAPLLSGSGEPVPTPTGDLFTSRLSADTFSDYEGYGLGMVIEWELGDLVLKSLTSYRTFDSSFIVDFDGSAAVLRDELVVRDHEQIQQEFQLQGSLFDDKVDYLVGLFMYNENPTDDRRQQRNTLGGLNQLAFEEETDSYALFGEANIHVSDKLDVTLGVRGTREDKWIISERNGVSGQAEEEFSSVTYRLSTTYHWSEDFMVYASAASGFKSGGFNDRSPIPGAPYDGLNPFDEELADTYEIGVKSDFWDGRARLNAALFHTDYTDLQLPALVGQDVRVTNVGTAEIDGIEFDLTLLLSENVQLNMAGALMDARITDDGGNEDISEGTQLARSPDASYSVGAEYLLNDVFAGGNLSARLDWGWKDDYRLVTPEPNSVTQEAFGLLSARLTYTSEDEDYRVSLFATNLNDEEYLTSGLNLLNTPFGATTVDVGRPQEWGLSLEMNF